MTDPNYMMPHEFKDSAWHQSLKKFKKHFERTNTPIMHIDIHGKKNRKNNMDIDLGVRAMEVLFEDDKQAFVDYFHNILAVNLSEALEDCPLYKLMPFRIAPEAELNGYWGPNGIHTFTHQSVINGIPACQFEIPMAIRHQLMVDDSFLDRFAKAIVTTYLQIYFHDRPSLREGKQVVIRDCRSNEDYTPRLLEKELSHLILAKKMYEQSHRHLKPI
mmetsp:Transcript_8008/g.11907  ORF Transcript_8008/g.11907 Transcript_8008/m.11907 type:complete len:217 (+) Transcript_8008:267-917(+)